MIYIVEYLGWSVKCEAAGGELSAAVMSLFDGSRENFSIGVELEITDAKEG
jgi:hypothetical protein